MYLLFESLPNFYVLINSCIEDITWWHKDIEYYFRVVKQCFTNECSNRVKHCFQHKEIIFISSSYRALFMHQSIKTLLLDPPCESGNWYHLISK